MITAEMQDAFRKAGYEEELAKVTLSNRPDLCEYQCNGAMAGAKKYKKAPFMIAEDVAGYLKDSRCFETVDVVKPGFINLKLSSVFAAEYLNEMAGADRLGVEEVKNPKTIIIDYGGPNVAKPLHVGHLRSAIIGESVKRIARFKGNKVIGDIHLGDWGYQMGLIITELRKRSPELVYFDDSYEGEYPEEAPFTIGELEEIYPTASAYAKEHEDYREEALHATYLLQNGHRDMVQMLKDKGYARYDEGALVVDVQEETDNKEVPPCMILKSDGAALYDTTDLATLVQREEDYHPDEVIYVVDKRQELHFIQVFRCAKKTGIVPRDTELKFLGFGTMNGKDGKPFKTREGGVMRLENLIREIDEEMYRKIMDNRTVEEEEAKRTAETVGLAAIKYGDLSNQASKDYIFDVDRFTSFEGNTGPYILYTIVRIKSILNKYRENGGAPEGLHVLPAEDQYEKALMLQTLRFNDVMETVYEETAPHKICAYIYELANEFNKFYHETKILAEEDETKKSGYIALLSLTKRVLETCIDLLGFEAPERM